MTQDRRSPLGGLAGRLARRKPVDTHLDRAEPVAAASRLVPGLLDEAAARAPGAAAVRDATGRWTYRELAEAAAAFARWLGERGVRPGDRIVVRLPSRREATAMLFGTLQCGAVFVPVNPATRPFQLSAILGDADPVLVIADRAQTAAVRELTSAPVLSLASVWPKVEALARACGRPSPAPASLRPDSLAVLIYTSGSTAAPKAVMCPHAQIVFATRTIAAELGYHAQDVIFCRFPLSWDYGLYKVLLTCASGAEIVLADRESDLTLLRRMRQTGTTIVPIVPSLAAAIVTLARRERGPLPPVRMFTNTGAMLPPATIDELRELFPGARVVRQFGQTECKRISIMPPELDRRKPGSVGRPLPGTEVCILDTRGRPLPPGTIGEIAVTGPHVMPGYWRSPEATARAFRRDRRTRRLQLHTGDYGYLDEDGYLYFIGRRDDMFKRKGTRMSILEIEAAAMDIPGIRAAAAIPPSGGRDLAIVVEAELAPHHVLRELADRLEPAKVPASCHVVSGLPLTAHGKKARRELAALLDTADAREGAEQ